MSFIYRIALAIWPGEVTISDRLLIMNYSGTEMARSLSFRRRIVLWMAGIYYKRVLACR